MSPSILHHLSSVAFVTCHFRPTFLSAPLFQPSFQPPFCVHPPWVSDSVLPCLPLPTVPFLPSVATLFLQSTRLRPEQNSSVRVVVFERVLFDHPSVCPDRLLSQVRLQVVHLPLLSRAQFILRHSQHPCPHQSSSGTSRRRLWEPCISTRSS